MQIDSFHTCLSGLYLETVVETGQLPTSAVGKGNAMRLSGRASLSLALALALATSLGIWMTAPTADAAVSAANLPVPGSFRCPPPPYKKTSGSVFHQVSFNDLGSSFATRSIGGPGLEGTAGPAFVNSAGQKTVPLQVTGFNVPSAAEGLGAVNYWLDDSRPVQGAIWEQVPGTEFPAIQDMRFNFFVSVESMPGRIFRSRHAASVRSNDVRAFPPPPGTVYNLQSPVDLEDTQNPGKVVGRIEAGQFVMP